MQDSFVDFLKETAKFNSNPQQFEDFIDTIVKAHAFYVKMNPSNIKNADDSLLKEIKKENKEYHRENRKLIKEVEALRVERDELKELNEKFEKTNVRLMKKGGDSTRVEELEKKIKYMEECANKACENYEDEKNRLTQKVINIETLFKESEDEKAKISQELQEYIKKCEETEAKLEEILNDEDN